MFDDLNKLKINRRLLAKILFAGSVFLCLSGNAIADLQITKTVDPVSPSPAAENNIVRYNLSVTNTGPGSLSNVIIDDTPNNLTNLNFTQTSGNPSGGPLPGPGDRYQFGNLADGETVTLNLDARVNSAENCPVVQNSASVSEDTSTFTDNATAANIEYDFEFTSGSASNVISHVTATSFCEFCDTGLVHIRITNPTTAALQNITLVEDLQSLGLTYINGSTELNSSPTGNPTISGGGSVLTWTSSQIGALSSLAAGNTLNITFRVSTYGEASILADPNRNLIASATFDMACITGTQTVNTGQFELPIRQPEPRLHKHARNFDAAQNNWQRRVYGSGNDDVIWRVRAQNQGDANMEALLINDSIDGNFSINFICPTLGDANTIAGNNGIDPGGTSCIGMNTPFDVSDPFGNIADPDDVADNSNGDFYYVGRILNTHQNRTNTADISWGCAATSSNGGLITVPATTNGSLPSGIRVSRTAFLNTNVVPGDLIITQSVTGSNDIQPLGTKGLMTITLNNTTGGSLQNLRVRATLPAGYVMDNSYGPGDGQLPGQPGYGQPTFTNTGAFGNYDGFIDTFTRDDIGLGTPDPLDDLAPTFTLTSSTVGADPVEQVDMLRHNDVVTITFGIIMVDTSYYDLEADLDLAEETPGNSDPNNALPLTNDVFVDFDAVDAVGVQAETRSISPTYNSNPEDLDVDISDSLFILTNDINVPLDLNVLLTNNGGHDADDHTTYVSFGQAMTVQTVPNGCASTSNPPVHPHWNQPATIPATAAVYACDRGTLSPGSTDTFTFSVIKNTNVAADDDLTFRADVVGEITRFATTTTPLSDPTPASIVNTTPNLQLANNYSLDAIRSRVLGFNLTKSVWYCTESGAGEPPPSLPPPATPADLDIQIGEDCNYHLESGGWFGFITPGYQLIAVEDIVVTDDLPDGQGFIHFDNTNPFNFNLTPNISFIIDGNGGAGTTPLDETDISWQFNAQGNGIVIKDEFFRVDLKTRSLNDPVDSSAPPNVHAAQRRNIARTSFNALFQSDPINGAVQPPLNISVSEALNIPGYPLEPVRRADLTVTEPNITVVKEVCNETLYGTGPTCSNFTLLADDGDTNDFYIYRITLTNEASSAGTQRAPAFNVISLDQLDVFSDLMLVVDFATDGLDNDGDGLIDAADVNGEGTINDNIVGNGIPAEITFSNTHSDALLRVDPGDSVTFYYRVDPDDAISPLQTLTNTVSMTYDSLDGDFGNQNIPTLGNSDAPASGRARLYNTTPVMADVRMIPLLAQPKVVVELSNTALVGSPHDVVVGEELRYLLVAELPVANLRRFKIRDELPAGIRCIEGQVVNLNAPPYAAAGFVPGGTITSTCTSTGSNDFVEWDFGNQQVTLATGTRFNFPISFIARVENTTVTGEGVTITNGGGTVDPVTCAGGVGVCYVNEQNTAVGLDFAPVDIVVREPQIVLTKTFAPVVNSDAGDVLTVTVTATNSGSAAAYNLRVLDDLVGSDLTYIVGSVSGTDPPDNVDIVTLGANQPIFSWNISNPDHEITPSSVKTFTFDVLVDITAQPLEILDNTIQAEWSSLPDLNTALNSTGTIGADGSALGLRNGVLPNAADAINNYETTASGSTSVLPVTMNKTDLDPAIVSTIGAHKNFQIEISLPEGTTNNLIVNDNLNATGLSYVLSDLAPFEVTYEFEGIQSINGSTTLDKTVFNSLPLNGATGNAIWDVGTVITQAENDPTENLINPVIRIKYFARINNDTLTDNGVTLQNSAVINYTNGEDASTEVSPPSAPPVETVVESLLVVSKTVTNLTSGAGPAAVGDVLEFRINFDNTAGTSTAFDTNVVDTLPVSLLLDTSFTPTVSGVPITGFNPTPSGAPAGPLIWGRGNADNSLDVPAGQLLVLTYRTIVQPGTPPNAIISNSALVDWTSLNDTDPSSPFERTGANCPNIVPPNDYCDGPVTAAVSSGAPTQLLKANPIDTAISIGEEFTYRITVPQVPQGTVLYDVQILDNLTVSAANLSFVSVTKVSGNLPWTPVNIGLTPDDLIIADAVNGNGIDIPAGEQIVIDVTVAMRNVSPPNDAGRLFGNAATYTFNLINDNDASRTPGPGNITPDMTVVEPLLQLDKRGPAGSVTFSAPIPYTLVVENVGTGPAFDTNIVDRLPDLPDVPTMIGGTCDVAPVNFDARITTTADEATRVRDLIRDTDYTATYTLANCELVITALTDKARIEASEKFIIDYDAMLNVGSESGATLTNIAGVTQWFSLDTAGSGATGEIREYTRTISDGTPGAVDHEDAFLVTVEAPVLSFQKTVLNLTTGNPGTDASPGDTLRYSILVTNAGPIDLPDFTITDEVDALAAPGGSFVPGSMTIFSIPAGADSTNTNINGGANSAGLLDVSNLSIDAAGGPNDTVTIEFDVTLLPVITSTTVVLNQAQLSSVSTGVVLSDDPLVGGVVDPTETLIASAPAFQVQKSSQDITGDPNLLEAGDTLRYTITIKNIGQENSINTLLSDQIPANTTYVADTTTLNGVAVTDPSADVSALAAGLQINAPENTTAGFMRADTGAAASNVATIIFDVVVNASAIDGTIISNQGFVSGDGEGSGTFPQVPSDDPTTAAVDDPTVDIVGGVALFDVQKTVAIVGDANGNGIVDPGDILRYTITATNLGGIPITNTVLTDAVPVSSQYVGNSTRLNGTVVTDPALNVSPLISGIDISSSDLTPPLPASGAGMLVPGQSAFIEFDVRVDATATAGTVISNQGFVSSNELPTEPTDADGIDSNGNQPTDVIVGSAPLLTITKQVSVVGGGAAVAGGELEYVVRVTNTGVAPVTNVIITDDLLPAATQMTYVANSGLLNGLPTGVSFAGTTLTADYSANYGDLPAAGVAELRFRVLLANTLTIGETVTNIGDVSWNVPPTTAQATVSIDIGGTPGTANLNGQVWHDNDFSNDVGVGETLLQGWRVDLYSNNVLLATALSGANGSFQFSGLAPNLPAGNPFELRYSAPGSVATTATLGNANSAFTNAPQRITGITAASGASIQNLNLPIQPNGVVYDSVQRIPASGVRLTMINQTRSNQPVPADCFDDPNQSDQVTRADGFYKFDLNFSDLIRCAQGDEYEIQVQPPSNNFVGTTSVIIPPANPVTGPAFDVTSCPGTAADQIPATAQHCENSVDAVQPAPSVAPTAVNYSLKFLFNNSPSTDQIFNNHIPVDPDLGGATAISKVAGMLNVTRSQLVPYTITVSNTLSVRLDDLNIIDNYPAGFKYVAGSSRLDGTEVEPQINGRQLSWNNLSIDVGKSRIIKLLLVVGSGVGEGEYVNTAQMINNLTNSPASGIASATVRVIPDPTFDCTDIIGKVFDDKNMNAYQDKGETGLPGVQVATARGLRVTTDQHGRFHITCAVVPNEVRGSNFIMKLDDRTLPSGYRMTTENPRVQRATRGKMLKFNFGAAIHRVVRLDLADGVFEKGTTTLRPQWRSRIEMLITELEKDASILRLSYLGENETEAEVDDRLDAIEELISDRWEELDCCYKLTIEKEVFWRKGNPSDRKRFE